MSVDEQMHVFPQFTPAERTADAIVHGVGITFGIAACASLALIAAPSHDMLLKVSLALYCIGLMAMLTCSALYNMTVDGPLKGLFLRFDTAAIFIMIAGTYTPFTFAIGGDSGLGLFIFVWCFAAIGASLKLYCPRGFVRLSIFAYLSLGWCIIFAIEPLTSSLSNYGLTWLVLGGVIYSIGVIFHLWERLPYQNAIWHVFVLTAAICHFIAILADVALHEQAFRNLSEKQAKTINVTQPMKSLPPASTVKTSETSS